MFRYSFLRHSEIERQYLKERIGIDLNRGENYSGRLVGLELGVGALVLRGVLADWQRWFDEVILWGRGI